MRADVYEAQLQRQRLLKAQGLAWRVITEADSRWRWAETRPDLAQALARGRQALFNLAIQHPAFTPELLELAREIEHMGEVGPQFHRLLLAVRQGRLDLQDWAPLADDPQRESEAAEVYRRVLRDIEEAAEQTYRACELLISQPLK
ncbi:hypothetical protein CXF96_05460 [Stenotrophomonas sp. Betaine-02u-21]|nr:hypothetical protein CXF90_15465 [Stenotrophomonas sp. Betaine-02u-23]PKH75184.1 hypothetical protein CXF96_05460 [Stenotrophomonas sp. Betaine-02u-21]PKH97607.1 hypothetical protein CXG43_01890 [Stenotrophomonas sp. Bg11-02]